MKKLLLKHLFFIGIAALHLGFVNNNTGDPKIIITAPTQEAVFDSGANLSLQIDISCNCMMDQLMVGVVKLEDYEMTAPIHYHKAEIQTENRYQYTTTISLPTVTEETEYMIKAEIQDKDNDDLAAKRHYFTIKP